MWLSFPHIPSFPLNQLYCLFYPLQVWFFHLNSRPFALSSLPLWLCSGRPSSPSAAACLIAAQLWWIFDFTFSSGQNLWVRFSHVVYFGVSRSSNDAVYCGEPRPWGNVGMLEWEGGKRKSLGVTLQTLKKYWFFFQTGYLLSLEFTDLAMPTGQWIPEIHLPPFLYCWSYSTHHQAWLLFVFYMGPGESSTSPTESSFSSLTWSFSRSNYGRAHFQTYSGRIYLYPDPATLTLDWSLIGTWKRHRESFLQILEGTRVTLPSFLALFFIWGLERVAARGRKPFETWSRSNWDKLKEMLLCRVESDLRECYIPKAKGWEYTQIKNTSDILINYVYENNPNGQQYGNS